MSPEEEPRAFEPKPPRAQGLEGPEADYLAQALRDKGMVAAPEEEAEAHPS